MTTEQELGLHIKHLRVEQDWTLEQLSTKAHISIATLCNIEKGKVPHVSWRTLYKIAKALKIDPQDLLRFKEDWIGE